MQNTDFNVLEFFCRANYFRASMHRITGFRASRNTNSCVRAKKANEKIASPYMLKSFFTQSDKVDYAILRVKLHYMK